jgi:DNA-binding NarL/FixJ family response regulator
MKDPPLRVLVVEDLSIIRLGVRQLILEAWPAADVVEARSVEEAASAVQAKPAQMVILDLGLPDATGIEAPAKMLRLARGVPILVMSGNPEAGFAQRLLEMGVSGYLPKTRAGEELVNAMRRVLDGGRYMTPELSNLLFEQLANKNSAGAQLAHEKLSAQEYRLMQLIAAGRTPAEIATIMSLSVKTVSSYRARLLAKGGWANNIELTKYCVQHGLTDPT